MVAELDERPPPDHHPGQTLPIGEKRIYHGIRSPRAGIWAAPTRPIAEARFWLVGPGPRISTRQSPRVAGDRLKDMIPKICGLCNTTEYG